MKTNVRYFRKKSNMTLEELSEKSGLSTAYLSLIERDMREPTLVTLRKIAAALHVTAEALWSTLTESSDFCCSETCTIVRREEKLSKILNPGVAYACLTENPLVNGRNVGMIAHYSRLDPGSDSNPDGMVWHDVDELVYVISGHFTCRFADRDTEVYAGDTVLIHKNTLHKFENLSDAQAECLLVRYVSA